MIVMIDPMLYLYAKVYRYNSSVETSPLSEETTNIITDYISGCRNVISLEELDALASEEEDV